MPHKSILRLAVVGAVFSALIAVGAPTAHARWGHELDLGVRTESRWVGFGLAARHADPSKFVVKRHLNYRPNTTAVVGMRKVYQRPGPATIRGCDRADYEIHGIDVTRQVTNGGYSMTGLEVGDTEISVTVPGAPWRGGNFTISCWIKVSSEGRVHDALTIRFES